MIYEIAEKLEVIAMRTFNPARGHGTVESVIAVLLVLSWILFIGLEIPIPAEYMSAITLVLGYLFGRNEPDRAKEPKQIYADVTK